MGRRNAGSNYALIKKANPEIAEEWKRREVPVRLGHRMFCADETYKDAVKMTFTKGAQLLDPSKLFNSSLESNDRRAIDFHENDKLEKETLRAAVVLNRSGS